jgi:hypothetical protein
MNPSDMLNLRAQRILNDPALLKQLAHNLKDHPDYRAALLADITDEVIREQLRIALEAEV